MGSENYSIFNCASIDLAYLHTNSTTHDFLFGAVAELTDNARDAGANTLHIECGEGQLILLDDGCGLDRKEVESVVQFGHSDKRMNPDMVGQYGNGLKSAAMRMGKDMILFTKKEQLYTCMMMSRTFLEDKHLRKVFVPTPSFFQDGTPYYETAEEMERHELEMEVVYKYSPFTTLEHLFAQFNRIETDSGTMVVCYNLRRIESGQYELDFVSDPSDIKLTGHEPEREEERNSLRAYLAVLYATPRMRVFLRGTKVDTKRILSTLYRPKLYKYKARNLKSCAEKELEECDTKIVETKDKVRQCKSEVAEFESKHHANIGTDNTLRVRYRMLQKSLETASEMVTLHEARRKRLMKSKASPIPLAFYFGLNIQHRNRYGCMVYNNGRLIRMYDKVSNQKEKNDRMLRCLGVVCVVDIPFSVLAPAHSKQTFENKREYENLRRSINDHMEQYWNDTALGATPGGVASFWQQYGYESLEWNAEPSSAIEFQRKRLAAVGFSLQCDECLKWRHLQFENRLLSNPLPKDWTCAAHPNSLFRNCSKREELPKVPEGRLIKIPDKKPITATTNKAKKTAAAVTIAKEIRNPPTARKRIPTPPPPTRRSLRGRGPVRKEVPESIEMSSEEEEEDSEEEAPPVARQMDRMPARGNQTKIVASTGRHSTSKPTRNNTTAQSQASKPKSRTVVAMARSPLYEDSSEDEPPMKRQALKSQSLARTKASVRSERAAVQNQRTEEVRVVDEPEPVDKAPSDKDEEDDDVSVILDESEDDGSVMWGEADELVRASTSTKSGTTGAAIGRGRGNDNSTSNGQPGPSHNNLNGRAREPQEGATTLGKYGQSLMYVVNCLNPSLTKKIVFRNDAEAFAFDFKAFMGTYSTAIDKLINEQAMKKKAADDAMKQSIDAERVDEMVDQRVRGITQNAVKILQWADPELAHEVTMDNVEERLAQFMAVI